MKDKDLIEILEKMKAPRADLPNAKALLRRRLVAGAGRPRRARRWPLQGATLTLGAAAALMAAFWLLPPGPTAAELIRDMEAVYGRGAPAGRIHYVRQLIRIQGQAPIEEERWSDEEGRRLRLLHRDVATGAILGQSILDGVRVYASGNSGVRVRRSIARLGTHTGDEPQRITARVLVPPSEEGAPLRAIVIKDPFDPDEFARRSPADIVSALASASNVDYAGTETDPESGRRLHVLTRRLEAISLDLESAEEIPEGVARTIEEESRGIKTGDRSLGAIERITVLADSSRVRGVTLVIDRNGEELYRLEKIFLGETYLDDSPTIFDPDAHGLAPLDPLEPPETIQEIP